MISSIRSFKNELNVSPGSFIDISIEKLDKRKQTLFLQNQSRYRLFLMPDPNSKSPKKIRLPMLPMRDIVVFPHMTAPFFIGRPLSIAALEEAH